MNETLAQLRVYLFDRFSVERGGHIVAGFEARRLQEMFSYLLLNRRRRCSREVLASLFWGESPAEQARKNLRQILWQLQNALEAGTIAESERILTITPEWVQINPRATLWLDVDFFEGVWEQTKNIPGKDLNAANTQLMRNAIALQQDALLPGNYDDWCLRERERLLALCVVMLEKLMEYSEIHHNHEETVRYGLRVLDFDRTSEAVHQRLMHVYYSLGRRVEALKQYRQCEVALVKDLGALPSKSTRALYQHILLDQLKSESSIETFVGNVQGEEILLDCILKELQAVQTIQTHAQSQIDFRMQKIEHMVQTLVGVQENSNGNLLSSERKRLIKH